MISRSLGAEAGSMIGKYYLSKFLTPLNSLILIKCQGIIFSFANAVLVSLNLVGAAETTVEILAVN